MLYRRETEYFKQIIKEEGSPGNVLVNQLLEIGEYRRRLRESQHSPYRTQADDVVMLCCCSLRTVIFCQTV